MRDDDEPDFSEESSGPPERGALLRERHQAMLERKRLARLRPPAIAVPTVRAPRKPAQAPRPKVARVAGVWSGKDYAGVMRAIGRPCSQAELAARAGVSVPAILNWMRRHGEASGVVGAGLGARIGSMAPRLFKLKDA